MDYVAALRGEQFDVARVDVYRMDRDERRSRCAQPVEALKRRFVRRLARVVDFALRFGKMGLHDEIELARVDDHRAPRVVAHCVRGVGRQREREPRRMLERIARGEIATPTEADLADCMDTAGHPDPDLVIRTSGETRTSNFLPWQAAYSEYEFTPTLWPDFTPDHLATILDRFGLRDRRFGGA